METSDVRYVFVGEPPNCALHAFSGACLVGRLDFDLADRPPAYIEHNAKYAAVRDRVRRQRDESTLPMVWLVDIHVDEVCRHNSIASTMLDLVVDRYPGRVLVNQTRLSSAGEGLLRSWLPTSPKTEEQLLWRADDKSA